MTWHEEALCKGQPQRAFFPMPKYSERYQAARLAPARMFCDRCPVRSDCLAEGVATRSHGVWGGVLLRFGEVVPESPEPLTGRQGSIQARILPDYTPTRGRAT
jgi:hypothetical protein